MRRSALPERVRPRRDPQALVDRFRKMASARGDFYDIPSGLTRVRICPGWDPNKDDYFLHMALHYGFKYQEQNRAIHCLSFHFDERCPVCDVLAWMRANKKTDSRIASMLTGPNSPSLRERFLLNGVVREVADNTIKILSFGIKIMSQINGIMAKPGIGDITDELEGWDLWIDKSGSGLTTQYQVSVVPDGRGPIGVPNWPDKLHNLDEQINRFSFDECVGMLSNRFPELPITQIIGGSRQMVAFPSTAYQGGTTMAGQSTRMDPQTGDPLEWHPELGEKGAWLNPKTNDAWLYPPPDEPRLQKPPSGPKLRSPQEQINAAIAEYKCSECKTVLEYQEQADDEGDGWVCPECGLIHAAGDGDGEYPRPEKEEEEEKPKRRRRAAAEKPKTQRRAKVAGTKKKGTRGRKAQPKKEQMSCGECGELVDEDATECPHCGAEFE